MASCLEVLSDIHSFVDEVAASETAWLLSIEDNVAESSQLTLKLANYGLDVFHIPVDMAISVECEGLPTPEEFFFGCAMELQRVTELTKFVSGIFCVPTELPTRIECESTSMSGDAVICQCAQELAAYGPDARVEYHGPQIPEEFIFSPDFFHIPVEVATHVESEGLQTPEEFFFGSEITEYVPGFFHTPVEVAAQVEYEGLPKPDEFFFSAEITEYGPRFFHSRSNHPSRERGSVYA